MTVDVRAEGKDDLDPKGEMSLIDHLIELRLRLIRSLVAVLLFSIVAYCFAERILEFLARPLINVLPDLQSRMVFTSLPEVFFVHIKIALFAGFICAIPCITYQIWRFISCALHRTEKKLLIPFILFSTAFFLIGVTFCYVVVFPWAFQFFISFSSETLSPMITLRDYVKFATRMVLVFGLIFEMPIAAAFLARIGIITPAFLRKNRKYSILVIFILAAILTPPDAITQLMLAAPMLILYEISVWAAVVFSSR